MPSVSCMRGFVVIIAAMAFVSQVQGSCYQFGHSCFGAHGKRSGSDRAAGVAAAGPLAAALAPALPQQTDQATVDILPGTSYDVDNINQQQDLPAVNNWLVDLVLRLRQRTNQQQQLLQRQQMMIQEQQQQLIEQQQRQQQQQLPERLRFQ